MTITDRPVDNGVNVQALLGAREALSAAPEQPSSPGGPAAPGATGPTATPPSPASPASAPSNSTAARTSSTSTTPSASRPTDNGATPVEYVLVGLAGCLTAGVASVAQHRDIQLRSVTATIEGEMNVLGILGADPDVRNGFEAVTVRFTIDADASRDDLQALIAQSQKRSAVFDIVTNPTKVLVELA